MEMGGSLDSKKEEADNREGWGFITAMSNCSQLQQLFINDNDAFTGKMPISTVNLSTTMQILNVQDTRISGSSPQPSAIWSTSTSSMQAILSYQE